MHKPSISQLVYKTLFPKPAKPGERDPPSSLQNHIQRNLVPEVRIETANFYGALDCIEAQYPGLDYTFAPHRRRLSRFPHHKQLFKVFDKLNLTKQEILSLCQWEGTKSAKTKYERDAQRPIRDTTMDDVASAGPIRPPFAYFGEDRDINWQGGAKARMQAVDNEGIHFDDEQTDEDETDANTSVGVQLNQQLRAAADARARGEPAVFDEQWEEWMKDILERNDMSVDAVLDIIRENRPSTLNPSPPLSTTAASTSATTAPPFPVSAISGVQSLDPRRLSQLQSTLQSLQATNSQLAADNAALAMALSPRPPTEAAR